MTRQYLSNDQRQELENKLLDNFRENLSVAITKYTLDNEITTSAAANRFGVPRETLDNWKTKQSLPQWESYFSLMLKLKAENRFSESGVSRPEELVQLLGDYVNQSIRRKCRAEGITSIEFAEITGYHSSSIYQWTNRHSVPRIKDIAKVFSFIYQSEPAQYEAMKPIRQPAILESGEYKKIVIANIPLEDDLALVGVEIGKSNPSPAIQHAEAGASIDSVLESLKSCSCETPAEKAALAASILSKLGDLISYFRQSHSSEREQFRKKCSTASRNLGLVAMETRQMLRKEEDYQNFLEMNGYKPNTQTQRNR